MNVENSIVKILKTSASLGFSHRMNLIGAHITISPKMTQPRIIELVILFDRLTLNVFVLIGFFFNESCSGCVVCDVCVARVARVACFGWKFLQQMKFTKSGLALADDF